MYIGHSLAYGPWKPGLASPQPWAQATGSPGRRHSPLHSPRQGLPVQVHPAQDEDARQALQLQVSPRSPLRILDFLPQLQRMKNRAVDS